MAALNPEPADPSDRKAHHLPPKSYADAAEEALHDNSSQNGTYIDEDSIKETPPNHRQDRPERRSLSEPRAFGEVLDEQENNGHLEPATPTRMPRKPVPGKSYADAAHEHLVEDSHPKFNVEGETQELSGEGIDASPRSPIRRIHKRAPSRSLNGDVKDFLEQNQTAERTDPHEQGQPKENEVSHKQTQPQERKQQDQNREGNEMSEKNQSNKDQMVNENGQSKVVYERFGNGDGETLTSVKPSDDFEEALRQDKLEESSSRKEEFASGKQAGSGWSTSA